MSFDVITRPWRPGDLALLRLAATDFSPDTLTHRFLTGTHTVLRHYLASLQSRAVTDRCWLGQVALSDGRFAGLAGCDWVASMRAMAEAFAHGPAFCGRTTEQEQIAGFREVSFSQ
ncbi:hypothetical protein AB0A95_18375 [Micromonospora sp. NPDC049230]|uniref:hypothetical protein n=1 Tax=Micromonospora sp. NPDC049230 TaxID=3155502 RepID=UPI0033C72B3C